MDHRGHPSSPATTLAVLGLIAIPFASVTAAVLVVGAASAADASAHGPGVFATVLGAALGAGAVPVARGLVNGLGAVATAAVGRSGEPSDWLPPRLVQPIAPFFAQLTVVTATGSPLWRRGPPSGLR